MNLYNARLHELQKVSIRLKERIGFLSKRSNRFSLYRLITFITGAGLSIISFYFSKETGWSVLALSLVSFSIIVHFHNKLLFGIKRCHSYLKIKEEHIARMNIDWERIPKPIINSPPPDLTTEKDLDLTGNYSLHNLIDTTISYEGSSLLRKWITNYLPDSAEIVQKQKIIKELSGLSLFRDKFSLKANLISKKYLDCSKIESWAKSSHTYSLPVWSLVLSGILIIGYLTLFLLNVFDITGNFWLITLMIYFFVYSSFQKNVKKVVEESEGLEINFRKFTALVLYIEKFSFENHAELKNFLRTFKDSDNSVSKELRKLQAIISALQIRENFVMRIILNLVFPYDIYFCQKLMKVRPVLEKNITGWLNAFNELECYMSLSNFAYLNPDYCFPEIDVENKNVFETRELGHPLLKRVVKVCNDFSTEKKYEITIITGSNMSGKSTFLRTVGINMCLANAGAPVNASYFKSSLYELFTCIKVTDSVVDGISYFYAEVKRLKELLDDFQKENGLEKFFLIDEIFKGTNNKERLIGSNSFIKKLALLNGTGMISTHDLELVNLEKEIPSVTNYHFREFISNGLMNFDYKIHKGPCPTTNALKIMEMAGLIS